MTIVVILSQYDFHTLEFAVHLPKRAVSFDFQILKILLAMIMIMIKGTACSYSLPDQCNIVIQK